MEYAVKVFLFSDVICGRKTHVIASPKSCIRDSQMPKIKRGDIDVSSPGLSTDRDVSLRRRALSQNVDIPFLTFRHLPRLFVFFKTVTFAIINNMLYF